MSAHSRAEELHQEAMALDRAGDRDLALEKYLTALTLDDSRSTTHYNVGLIYKYRGQWSQSFAHNERAVQLAPADEAANWNLAIAATALRDWRTARRVWHGLGLPIDPGTDPIEDNFGLTPVRLDPGGDGEVVWGRRVDPVRVRILSIPYPGSGFRYRDVVLHDGAAVGYRLYEGRERPVFNVLELFESSYHATYEAELRVPGPGDIARLHELCDELGIEMEDWTTSVKSLCRQCSEGKPHEQHDRELGHQWQVEHFVGFASTDEARVRSALDRWTGPQRALIRLELALAAP